MPSHQRENDVTSFNMDGRFPAEKCETAKQHRLKSEEFT